MKKTLVAIAALAATGAFAQQLPSGANPSPAWGNGVLITGGLDASYSSLTYKGGNKYSGVTYNSTSTSQIDFAGVFDLGNGMKADFFFENDINPTTQYNTGVAGLNGIPSGTTGTLASPVTYSNFSTAQAASTWGNGQVKIGLSGAFGYVALGAVNNAGLDWNQLSGPFGTAWGSGYGVTQGTVGAGYGASAKVRYDNSVRYLTPELGVAGLKGSLTYRNKNDVAANTQFSTTTGKQALSGVQELAAIYMNGPLNLIYVNLVDDGNGIAGTTSSANTQALTLTASGAKYTANSLGGNYTMGAATLYYGRQTMKNDTNSVDNKTDRFGIKYAATPVLFLMATQNKLTNNVAGTTSKVTGVGADYMLSKTTALTFRMDRTDDGAGKLASDQALAASGIVGSGFPGAATAADNQRNRTAVGLRIGF